MKYDSAAGIFILVGPDSLASHFHLVHFCTPVPSIMTHQDNLLKTCSSQELGWVGGKPVHMQIFWVCSCIMPKNYSVTFSFSRWYFKKSNTLNGSLGSWRIDTIRDTHIQLFYFFSPFSHCTEKKQRDRHSGISSLFLNPSLGSIVRVAVLVIKVSAPCTSRGTSLSVLTMCCLCTWCFQNLCVIYFFLSSGRGTFRYTTTW